MDVAKKKINKIANEIISSLGKIAVGTGAWYNNLLKKLAEDYNIPLKKSTNLWAYAILGAKKAGAGQQSEDLAKAAIDIIIFRKKREGEKEYSKEYVRSNILRLLVRDFRKQGWSLEETLEAKQIQSLIKKYNFKKSLIEKIYTKKLKPNKEVKLQPELKPIERPGVFEAFDGKKGNAFETFFVHVVTNEVKDLLQHQKDVDRIYQTVSIVPKRPTDTNSLNQISLETLPGKDYELMELRMVGKHFIRSLKKLNPLYVTVMKLIQDGKDLFKSSHQKVFETVLGLSRSKFLAFRENFIADMKKLVKEGDITKDEFAFALRHGKKIPLDIRFIFALIEKFNGS